MCIRDRFHSRARKAIVAANPVNINGVARVNISEKENIEPNTPLIINWYAKEISAPANARGIAARNNDSIADASGTPSLKNQDTVLLGSTLNILFLQPSSDLFVLYLYSWFPSKYHHV